MKPFKRQKVDDTFYEPVTMEFHFCSEETKLLQRAGFKGRFQIPLLRHVHSGRFRFLHDDRTTTTTTKLQGQILTETEGAMDFYPELTDSNFSLGIHLYGGHDHVGYVATIGMPHDPLDNDDFDELLDFHLGNCDFDLVEEQVYVRNKFQTYPLSEVNGKLQCYDEQKHKDRLHEWIHNAEGYLTFYAYAFVEKDLQQCLKDRYKDYPQVRQKQRFTANYKIKLLTALSTRHEQETIERYPDAWPRWDMLRNVLQARFPDKPTDWPNRAIQNYIYFLDIKRKYADYKSEMFYPSQTILEVIKAHLSFPDQYEFDSFAYCGRIMENSVVFAGDAHSRYIRTYKMYKDRAKLMGTKVDPEFWPEPQLSGDLKDGDSQDACTLGSTYEEEGANIVKPLTY